MDETEEERAKNEQENNNENQFFYPLVDNELAFKDAVDGQKLMCIDEDVELYGDFNTANGKILFLGFVKCDTTKRNTCKSEKEVNEWLKS